MILLNAGKYVTAKCNTFLGGKESRNIPWNQNYAEFRFDDFLLHIVEKREIHYIPCSVLWNNQENFSSNQLCSTLII